MSKTCLFTALGLDASLVKDIAYSTPTPIQEQAIPVLLAGQDIIGQAQTGTGKTAAFALPLLSRLDFSERSPQLIVLTPTRELCLQVAEAFNTYGQHLKIDVTAIYGGESMGLQLSKLKRGTHIVVGTPGRVMDHLRRKSLKLNAIKAVVLDEADEMLNRGFLEDIQWILEQTPQEKQVALFSATMPNEIRKIAQKYLKNPKEIKIKSSASSIASIKQYVWPVTGCNKLEAISRILEVENCNGCIVFVRTKTATITVADALTARGLKCAALNGDMAQNIRTRTVENLKSGVIDILVATDVAARGLDVDRISLVINYDAPPDPEVYVHRIGRTGRAGRQGTAILFLGARENNIARNIERSTKMQLSTYKLPNVLDLKKVRLEKLKANILETINTGMAKQYRDFILELQVEGQLSEADIAAALCAMNQAPINRPAQLGSTEHDKNSRRTSNSDSGSRRSRTRDHEQRDVEPGMARYRLSAGRAQGMNPGILVGAIASASGIPGSRIGHIRLLSDHSTVELPLDIEQGMIRRLKNLKIKNQVLSMKAVG